LVAAIKVGLFGHPGCGSANLMKVHKLGTGEFFEIY
jgi:hypothetical protein